MAKPRANPIDIQYLRTLFRYDSETGLLVWATRGPEYFQSGKRYLAFKETKQGRPVDIKIRNGYATLNIKGKPYRAHRVIWAIYYCSWPDGVIDHINGNPMDNRIENLRDATLIENARNQKMHSTNTSGHMGVQYLADSGKWVARIHIDGASTHLGVFEKYEDAVQARLKAEAKYDFHINHGRETSPYSQDQINKMIKEAREQERRKIAQELREISYSEMTDVGRAAVYRASTKLI